MHFCNQGRPTPSLAVTVQCRYRVCLPMIPSLYSGPAIIRLPSYPIVLSREADYRHYPAESA